MLNIIRPTLVIDQDKVKRNIRKMLEKAKNSNVTFRPHFKTHQSREIAEWFQEYNVQSIAVSSLDMAAYFAGAGWKDIMVAVPVNILEINKINEIAAKIDKLHLLFDSLDVIQRIDNSLTENCEAWLKVDTGYHRAGIDQFDFDLIIRSIELIKQTTHLKFHGLVSHSGHSYDTRSFDDLERIRLTEETYYNRIKNSLEQKGIHVKISVGDTPSCSLLDDFAYADELRPGNFVFYDLVQEQIGSCTEDDIAVAVACPVIAKYEHREQILIYGGSVHLSKDSLVDDKNQRIFGYFALAEGNGWGKIQRQSPILNVSQEVSKVKVDRDIFDQINIGDIVYVLPAHSCLTVDLYSKYYSLDGKVISKFQSNINS